MEVKCERDYGYDYPTKAKYHGLTIYVRKMRVDEMPENGITYYCHIDGMIFKEGERNFKLLTNN